MKSREGAYSPAFARSRAKLKALAPDTIAANSGYRYNTDQGYFELVSFGVGFRVSYPGGEIVFADDTGTPPLWWSLILLNYLSSARPLPLSGEWASYRDLPQGNVFFPALKRDVLDKLAAFLQVNWTIWREAGNCTGFVVIPGRADLTLEGWFAPRVPVRVLFWEGDEEIAPACQILFDRSAGAQMHIEDLAALCYVIKDLIIKGV